MSYRLFLTSGGVATSDTNNDWLHWLRLETECSFSPTILFILTDWFCLINYKKIGKQVMGEYFEAFFFLAFFYWPIYLVVAALVLFLVFKFWSKKTIVTKLLLVIGACIGGVILLPALYVIFMIVFSPIINL